MDDERKTEASEPTDAGFDSERLERKLQADTAEDLHVDYPEEAASIEIIADESGLDVMVDTDEEDQPGGEDQPEDEDTVPEMLSETELNEVIEHICNSKAEEFRMLGYEHVTGREVWECVSDKYHKTGAPPLHRVVNDILSLKVTQFMNWMTMSIYKSNPFQ